MKSMHSIIVILAAACIVPAAHATVVPDRTRIIYETNEKAQKITVRNDSKVKPYLAQAWISRENDNDKADLPLIAMPPLQRIESDAKSLVTLRALPAAGSLPQDRESLYYFNLRGIPPKAEGGNMLQLAIQTRIKVFYRPAALAKEAKSGTPWQERRTLKRSGDAWVAENPTPFHIVVVGATGKDGKTTVPGFSAVTVAPKSSERLSGKAAAYGNAPVLTYINDYGGQVALSFSCNADACSVASGKAG